MRVRRGARLDTGQVTDLRGRRMGGPRGMALGGGGGIGAIVLVVYLLITLLGSADGALILSSLVESARERALTAV